jgi:hypothetical protein
VCVLSQLGEIMRRHELGFPSRVEHIQPGRLLIPGRDIQFIA